MADWMPDGGDVQPRQGWVARKRAEKAARDAQLVCPHCQVRGRVVSRPLRVKRGVSGGKAAGAVFTMGASMLATGLSRKQWVTRMRCGNCGAGWIVE